MRPYPAFASRRHAARSAMGPATVLTYLAPPTMARMQPPSPSLLRLASVLFLLLLLLFGAACALPQGFTDEALFVADKQPMALRWLPDGRVLVLERLGRITLASADGSATATYMLLPNVAQGVELGLFDLALHPEFEKTRQFYIYYSPQTPERLRVSVFTHEENAGGMSSRGLLQSEQVIYQEPDTSYQSACCHYGGGAC